MWRDVRGSDASGAPNADMDMDMDASDHEDDDSKRAAAAADDELPQASADIDASKIRGAFKRDDGKQLSRAARVQVSAFVLLRRSL